MTKVSMPFEVRACFRVPRQQADKLVSKFKTGINFPGLLPNALKSSDAGIRPDSGKGPEATVWVLFKPRDDSHPGPQPRSSFDRSNEPICEPGAKSAYADLLGSENL